jgi:hypothetical protein
LYFDEMNGERKIEVLIAPSRVTVFLLDMMMNNGISFFCTALGTVLVVVVRWLRLAAGGGPVLHQATGAHDYEQTRKHVKRRLGGQWLDTGHVIGQTGAWDGPCHQWCKL